MSKLGTEERPLRVAIVGGGPSGFYASDALLTSDLKVNVDVFDRLPPPYGLVRYGVAPDHPKIKNVTKVYERIAAKEGFRYFGNVEIGKDFTVAEMKKYYDAICFTCGAETDKKLGIPGEDLAGSHTATEFVGWYNGHPDYKDRQFDLSQEVAVVIGQGNVAMDVTRILSKTVEELKSTDIAQHALDALSESKVKEIHLVGRRGPVQAAFTPPEIREFGDLEDCDPYVDAKDLELSEASQTELDDPKANNRRKNFECLQEYASRTEKSKGKKFIVHFYKSPIELKGEGKLEKIILEKNELSGEAGKQKAKGTGETEELGCGLLFRSVGYRGVPIEGVPFHEQWGSIHNEGGRVTENDQVVPGMYTAGWIKRGPSGVIGTNKACADETIKNLIEDIGKLPECDSPGAETVVSFLKEKGIEYISFDDWKKVDAAEVERGEKVGKPREKFVSIPEMLAAAKGVNA